MRCRWILLRRWSCNPSPPYCTGQEIARVTHESGDDRGRDKTGLGAGTYTGPLLDVARVLPVRLDRRDQRVLPVIDGPRKVLGGDGGKAGKADRSSVMADCSAGKRIDQAHTRLFRAEAAREISLACSLNLNLPPPSPRNRRTKKWNDVDQIPKGEHAHALGGRS